MGDGNRMGGHAVAKGMDGFRDTSRPRVLGLSLEVGCSLSVVVS